MKYEYLANQYVPGVNTKVCVLCLCVVCVCFVCVCMCVAHLRFSFFFFFFTELTNSELSMQD